MLVNFALECLDTEVTCDKVSGDGYEPRNLLSASGVGWSRPGFLAERFIKPPVTLTFKLPCPVNLRSIILDPRVGTQRSSVIEIYTAAGCRTKRCVPNTVGQLTMYSSQKEKPAAFKQISSEPIFKKIGSIHCLEPGQICFYNPNFNSSHFRTADHSPDSYPHRAELRHHQAGMLAAVDVLAVRIVGTANSSTAAIGKLEIWGVPGRSCPPQLRQDVIDKYAMALGSQGHPGSSYSHQSTSNHVGNTQHSVPLKTKNFCKDPCKKGEHPQNKDDVQHSNSHLSSILQNPGQTAVQIPDDFLDALTCEIMSVPMLLPSGQSVDLSTLDRFSEAEANYGRKPSDPFTGLTFTATRKPVANTALKVRIDHFLVKHANEPSLCRVPRALGHAVPTSNCSDGPNIGKQQCDCVSSSGISVRNRKRTTEDRLRVKVNSQTVGEKMVPNCIPSKDCLSVSSLTPVHKKMKTEEGASVSVTQIQASSSGRDLVTRKSATVSSSESHEERLRSSLSSSLASVLGRLPTFTSPTIQHSSPSANNTAPEPGDQCTTCQAKLKKTLIGSSEQVVVLYKFPCYHLVCRACLVKAGLATSTEVTCYTCCKQFARADLVRTHV